MKMSKVKVRPRGRNGRVLQAHLLSKLESLMEAALASSPDYAKVEKLYLDFCRRLHSPKAARDFIGEQPKHSAAFKVIDKALATMRDERAKEKS